jgi:uncharacterized protein with PIN domain
MKCTRCGEDFYLSDESEIRKLHNHGRAIGKSDEYWCKKCSNSYDAWVENQWEILEDERKAKEILKREKMLEIDYSDDDLYF